LGVLDFMNAQPSFEPSEYLPQPQISSPAHQLDQSQGNAVGRNRTESAPRKRARIKSNPVHAHRRQGLESVVKVATYSALSVFGVVTLVNLIGYNWSQQGKLQHLETELKDAKLRTEKINHNFGRSFDPQAQKSVMEENSYKIAPDRRQIVLITPRVDVSLKAVRK
jgi:hypothetical protein